jgi:hypothetical protein
LLGHTLAATPHVMRISITDPLRRASEANDARIATALEGNRKHKSRQTS